MSSNIQINIKTIELQISDDIALEQWERLIGCKIHCDYVKLTREFYEKHFATIEEIQLMGELRVEVSNK